MTMTTTTISTATMTIRTTTSTIRTTRTTTSTATRPDPSLNGWPVAVQPLSKPQFCADTFPMRHLLLGHRLAAIAGALALSGLWAGTAQASDPLAYVANEGAGAITSVDLTTGTLGTPIAVGTQPDAIAITPNDSTAYVADYGSSEIVPVNLATGTARTPIHLQGQPTAIAVTPNGEVAYVVSDEGTACPITLATGQVGSCKKIPTNSDAIAIAPSGQVAYITNVADATISPLSVPGDVLGQPINLDSPTPDGIAITPDGLTAYVASNSGGTITPITLASGIGGTPIQAGTEPSAIAITPDGSTAYVTDFGSGVVMPITLASGIAGTPLAVGPDPSAIALVPVGGVTPGSGSGPVGGGSRPGSSSGPPPATIGNQKLTLTLSAPAALPGATAGAQTCRAPRSTLRATLKRQKLRRGVKLRLSYVTFTLGKQVKRAKRLPATVKLSLRGLKAGFHTLTVKAFYRETLTAHASARRHRHKLTVIISKKLTTRIRVC
jgi:DNA-binding beta-propeller fold protein YncE